MLAQAELTPLDLMTAIDDPDKLQNLLRTLQTLDADSDPSNGITINPTAQEYLDQFVLPLNQPAFLFEASNVVQDMIAAVTNGSDLKSAVESFIHFRETMLSTQGRPPSRLGRPVLYPSIRRKFQKAARCGSTRAVNVLRS